MSSAWGRSSKITKKGAGMIGKMTEVMFGLWLSAEKLNCEDESERLQNRCKRFLILDCVVNRVPHRLSVIANEVVDGEVVHVKGGHGQEGEIFWHLPKVRDLASDLSDMFKAKGKLLEAESMTMFRNFTMWLEDQWCRIGKGSDFCSVVKYLALK